MRGFPTGVHCAFQQLVKESHLGESLYETLLDLSIEHFRAIGLDDPLLFRTLGMDTYRMVLQLSVLNKLIEPVSVVCGSRQHHVPHALHVAQVKSQSEVYRLSHVLTVADQHSHCLILSPCFDQQVSLRLEELVVVADDLGLMRRIGSRLLQEA